MNLFRNVIATITFISLFCQGISCNPMAEGPILQDQKIEKADLQEKQKHSLVLPLLILGASCLFIISAISDYEYAKRLQKKLDRLREERHQQGTDMGNNNKILDERMKKRGRVIKALADDVDAIRRMRVRREKEREIKKQRLRNQ